MRIFSKFHDYYDTAIGYGIDPNITYERKEKIISINSKEGMEIINSVNKNIQGWEYSYMSIFNSDLSILNSLVLFFCGKIYPIFKIETRIGYMKNEIDFFYDSKSLLEKVGNKKISREMTRYFREFFNHSFSKDEINDIHFLLDSPIIIVKKRGDENIIINPKLKDYRFYKIVDSFTAFQELSMFIGGVMGGKVPKMIEISNEDKIAKHGFDKWSFRKEKKQ